MGFYIELQDENGRGLASKSFQVWNPNVEHIFVGLGLENPYGDYSGDKGKLSFAYDQLIQAYQYVEQADFYNEPIIEMLDPFVAMFTMAGKREIDAEMEKNRTLIFLKACIDFAENSEKVTLYMG
ncbi:hypothetical protein M3181_22025 [Mesobacillus maritimus]|uniref:hypothetical protein n=1 Tax=Mesobacillus maritimus TaxID=1643336 RepID=UPI00203B464D|nr:hypothetical protein [Mesobacillus maritimus]MCM3671638.1 hypothetical protein [Mesobacillus maritimus]